MTRLRASPGLALVALLVWIPLAPAPADAHSFLKSTVPEENEVLTQAPDTLRLLFRDPVDVYDGSIHVLGPDGDPVERAVIPTQDRRTVLVSLERDLVDGTYTVAVTVLSLDGHPLREEFSFTLNRRGQEREVSRDLVLLGSNPPDGTIMETAPARVELAYNQPVQAGPGILVLDDQGDIVTEQVAFVPEDDPAKTIVPLPESLRPGTYAVFADVASADGKHRLTERFYFAVGKVTPVRSFQASFFQRVGRTVAVEDLPQWFSFWGLLALLGGTWFAQRIAPERSSDSRWRWASWGLAALTGAGFLLLIRVRGAELSGASLSDLLSLRIGWTPLVQILLVGFGVWQRRRRAGLLALAFAALLWTATGHSFAPKYGGVPAMLLDGLHVLAAAVWWGGLLGLMLMMPRQNRPDWLKQMGRRYSAWAFWSMAALALTGLGMTLDYAGTWRGFLASAWGQTLIVKLILVSFVVGLGGSQRRRLKDLHGRVVPFVRTAWTELAIGLLLVFVVAVLIDLNPLAGIFPETVTAEGIEATLEIEPFVVGENVTRVRFRPQVDFARVKMRFFMPPDWYAENHAFDMGDGVFQVVGTQLHGPGTMYVRVVAETAGGETVRFPWYHLEVPAYGR